MVFYCKGVKMGYETTVEYEGEKYSFKGFCDKFKLSKSSVYYRLSNGMTLEEIVEKGSKGVRTRSDYNVPRVYATKGKKYLKYNTKIFMHREGLMAYAGVTSWNKIKNKVEEVYLKG